MNKTWSLVKLGDILTKSEELIEIEPDKTYRQVRVRLWGNGLVLRGETEGAQIATPKQYVIRSQQFLVSRIDARNGASGVVPNSLDGAIVSNDFPAFNLDQSRIFPEFLGWMSKTASFVELCKAASEGTTNRVRLKLDRFLTTIIPLPPLDEQRRIVARIEELAAKVEQARGLRREAVGDTELLIKVALRKVFGEQNDNLTPLNKVAEIARGKFAFRPRNDPRFYGGDIPFIQIGDISNSNHYIRSYSQTLNEDGLNISRMFPEGTVVIAITGATIGVTGILAFESCFPDSIVGIIPCQDVTFSEYIYWSLEYVKNIALAEATQTTQPNINLRILNKLEIPFPSISEQQRIVAYLDGLQAKVEAVKHHQATTAARLDALLPSILDKAFRGSCDGIPFVRLIWQAARICSRYNPTKLELNPALVKNAFDLWN